MPPSMRAIYLCNLKQSFETVMKNTNIIPQGAVTLHNGEAARPGQASDLLNMRPREDALEVAGLPKTVAHIPPGDRLITIDHDHYITLHGQSIVWNGQPLATTQGEVLEAHAVGQFVVIPTTQGFIYLHRTTQGYDQLQPRQAIPQLHLEAVERGTLHIDMNAYQFNRPLTQWQYPLPTDDVTAIHSMVLKAYQEIQRQAHEEGRFTSPILARYGVRLWDDSYLWLSAPVLLGSYVIKKNYRTATQAVTTDGKFSGIAPASLPADTFRLGITVVNGIDKAWLGLVKAIDIFTTRDTHVALTGLLDYRMGTRNVDGSRRYGFEMGLMPRNGTSIVNELLEHGWVLEASTSQLELLNAGTFRATNVAHATTSVFPGKNTVAVNTLSLATSTLSLAECQEIMKNCNQEPLPASTMEHNGKLYCGGGAIRLLNPWSAMALFAGEMRAVPCQVLTTLRVKTGQGNIILSKSEDFDYTPQLIAPFLAASDARTVHLQCEVTSEGTTRTIDLPLVPHNASGTSIFLQEDATSTPFTTGTTGTLRPTFPVIEAGSELWMSPLENPFIHQLNQRITGTSIKGIAVACRPIYSGGFGHYPIYVFTAQGIFVLPQRTSGDYGEARIIARKILADGFTPVEGGGSVWFKTMLGDLCSVNGSLVKSHGRWSKLKAIAWNETEGELWMLDAEGHVSILFDQCHWTRLSLTATHFFQNAEKSLAIDAQGQVMNLQQEENVPSQEVYYLSHPFQLPDTPQQVQWNFMGDHAKLTFSLRGERGSSCHGYLINSIHATGTIAAPLCVPLVVQPSRTLRMEIKGTMPSSSLLRPTCITT